MGLRAGERPFPLTHALLGQVMSQGHMHSDPPSPIKLAQTFSTL